MSIQFNADWLHQLTAHGDHPLPPPVEGFVSTSVFMLIFNKNDTPRLLTVLKADNQGYPWRNQIALPGGHIDEQDGSSLEAAYRELEEELRIPAKDIEYIGSLGHFQTIQQKDIEVFLGLWNGETRQVKFDPTEIAQVLQPSIPMLLKRHVEQHFNGRIPGVGELIYPVDNRVIWGVTARIVHYFLELLLSRMSADTIQIWVSEK